MARPESRLTYNYAERETETLEGLVQIAQTHLGKKAPTLAAPLPLLEIAASLVQIVTRGRSPLHPARVRKAALSTHIVPEVLSSWGSISVMILPLRSGTGRPQSPGDF